MSKSGETKFSTQSELISERLGEINWLTGTAKEGATAFVKLDTKLQALCKREGDAEAAKDTAIERVFEFDGERDAIIPDIAAALVGAKITQPKSPFKGFSKYSPVALTKLHFTTETKFVIELCETLKTAKVPASVKSLGVKLAKAPHTLALKARNEFMPEWHKALSNLRLQMKAALNGQPGAYEALFSAPESAPPPKPRKPAKGKPEKGVVPAA
jgi:hypothetical protein